MAQKQKSCTPKSLLMQDWVLKLGFSKTLPSSKNENKPTMYSLIYSLSVDFIDKLRSSKIIKIFKKNVLYIQKLCNYLGYLAILH